ncbi:hypothetical protein LEP1GSC151_1872 [Leptospira interrogans serovar Grippotyphosa str. LT2186]|uniref:Uncharacterized protein n=8 Tax=Leptospira interrogans TaxID=173 RepID=A0A0E2D299_LEPIR|nr:hypothetical protein BRAT_15490 [Leptospira interrogans serovar Bratislava]ALE40878.1 hypothetical protein G436_3732 [Leptospira interrogans serovar Hardjo str. Norma]ALO01654.1 hypothetical protein LIH_14985 [Leptospira interrogans serovar Hardjo-prajitno]EJO77843.1 hypothetical protein LEP1GSC045_1064 [Leptospira interrogans serovar Pomona str. Kennewicki LC82-25]EJP02492.1 hypothetical protein LEP1GSC007_0155 [Leptospira interrogans serovar Bulgarica str. Mallika]EJP15607.1 hypothetical 
MIHQKQRKNQDTFFMLRFMDITQIKKLFNYKNTIIFNIYYI